MLITIISTLIVSICSACIISQQKEKIENTISIYKYTHKGEYDYRVYITDNDLFDSNVLLPGQKTYFKRIIDHIDGTYTYEFTSNNSSQIEGTYTISAEIKNNLWTKKITIIPSTPFDKTTFTAHFPIDIAYFDNVIQQINSDIGITARDTTLVITCDVSVNVHTVQNKDERFSSSLVVNLDNNIIEIADNLTMVKPCSIDKTITIYISSPYTHWIALSIILFAFFIGFFMLTTNEQQSENNQVIKKIHKKYGEWIVKVDKLPQITSTKIAVIKQFDDLVKVSEETSKPILYYEVEDSHKFYVFDEIFCYKYELKKK